MEKEKRPVGRPSMNTKSYHVKIEMIRDGLLKKK